MHRSGGPVDAAVPKPSRTALAVFAKNGVIQSFEQGVNIVLGLVTTVAIARVFGPEFFGAWTLALYLFRVGMGLTGYGLDILTLRSCETRDAEARRFLSTAVLVRLSNALLLIALASGLLFVLFGRDAVSVSPIVLLLMIFAPALIAIALEPIEFWFRAGQNAVAPAIARITATMTGTVLKLALIAAGASLYAIGAAHTLQLALTGLALFGLLRLSGVRLAIDATTRADIIALYRRAFPLFLSQAALMAAMRLDIILLSLLHTDHEVGIYSASLRICEAIYVLPVVVMTAASPFLFRLYRTDMVRFVGVFQNVLTAFNVASLALAISVAIFAPTLVQTVFGEAYEKAAEVLAIQVFALVGLSQAVATEYWWIARRRNTVSVKRTLAGAATVLLVSLVLVPYWGASGAAVATVCAAWVGGVGVHLLLGKSGRHVFRLQFVPKWSLRSARGSVLS